jgi:hypothetical protein
MNLGRPLSDLIGPVVDPDVYIIWKQLPKKAVTWLDRVFQRAGIPPDEVRDQIKFAVFQRVYETDLKDARNLGPIAQYQLIQLLSALFRSGGYEPVQFSIEPEAEEDFDSDPKFNQVAPESLSQLLDHYLARVQIHFDLNDRVEIVRMRSELFTDDPASLQEVGDVFGVTRERIRQILKKLDDYVIMDFDSLPILDEIVTIAFDSESESEFEAKCSELYVTDYKSVSLRRLMAICRAYNRTDLIAEIAEIDERWALNKNEKAEVIAKLRSIRGNSGLIDVELFADTHELDLKEARDLIVSVYPRTLFFDRYCLARTENLNPVTETTLFLLLKTYPGISLGNLLIGIKRRSRRRGDAITIPDDALVQMIHLLAGETPLAQNMLDGIINEPSLDTHDSWLLQTLGNTEKKYMHASEILTLAIQDGMNLGSISQYLSTSAFIFSPIARSGMYALLDQNPNEQEIRNYRSIAVAMLPENLYDYFFEDSKLTVDMRLNVQAASSGSLIPPSDLLDLVKGFEFSLSCDCGELRTDQSLKVQKTFWVSISPFARHLLDTGNYKINSSMQMSLDFGLKVAELKHNHGMQDQNT